MDDPVVDTPSDPVLDPVLDTLSVNARNRVKTREKKREEKADVHGTNADVKVTKKSSTKKGELGYIMANAFFLLLGLGLGVGLRRAGSVFDYFSEKLFLPCVTLELS